MRAIRTTALTAGLVALTLAAAACGGGTSTEQPSTDRPSTAPTAAAPAAAPTAAPATPASTEASTTTEAPLPTEAPETPAPTAPPAAPAPEAAPQPEAPSPADEATPPPPAVCDTATWTTDPIPLEAAPTVTNVSGDWNGDGLPDGASSYALDQDGTPWWYIRLDTNGGASSVIELGDLGIGWAQVSSAVDVDFGLGLDHNEDELIAITGSYASGLELGVFGTDDAGCAFRFDDGLGEAFRIPVVATIGQRSGLRCEGAAGSQFLVALEASTDDELEYSTVDTRIGRTGPTTLEATASFPGTLAAEDPALLAYSQAECFDTLLVGGPSDF